MRSFRRLVLRLVLLIVTISGAGCASSSSVKLQSDSNIRLSHKGGTPNTRLSILRSEARWYAHLYCQSQKKNIHVIAFQDAEGPFFSGNFPSTNIIFSCAGS
jgi:hypothetical protein